MPTAPDGSACYDCVRYDGGNCFLLMNYMQSTEAVIEAHALRADVDPTFTAALTEVPPVSKDCQGFLRLTKTRQSTEDLKEPTIAEARPPDSVAPTKQTEKDESNA